MRRRIAVVGSGVSGLVAAHVIADSAHVTVFEADTRLGGHADTHRVPGAGAELAIDTGFIVHNDRTYPTLLRLFAELGVRTRPAPMSMSVRADAAHGGAGLEYAGAKGWRGLFGSRRNLVRPAYLRMLVEIVRFHRDARRLLADRGAPGETITLEEFCERGRYSEYFREHFLRALVATVWSCDPALAGHYPARYLFMFLDHHGMLGVLGSPDWRTVVGGSQEYVRRVTERLADRGATVLTGTKVTSVREHDIGVEVTDGAGHVWHFDAVVMAVHPDQALAVLADPTPAQRDVLGAIDYSSNVVQLHTDVSVMPRCRRVWASWNHLARAGGRGVVVTYDLTRLMRLPSPDGTRHLVTLNAPDLVEPSRVVATREYGHPIYTPTSVAALERADEIDSDRIAFAGAWRGWGFHEDGARSGVAAAERLGLMWGSAPPATARRYRTTIRHARTTPVRHRFTHRSHLWLVDLDHLPRHGRLSFALGRFEARDHVGDPHRPIRANIEALLADHGLDATGGRMLMAALPRAWGHCFNPLSAFWCFGASGELVACVLEVHNTYGGRHAYVVRPDASGRACVDKQLPVSPFHDADGCYVVRAPVPTPERLEVSVTLHGAGGYRFAASVRGVPATTSPLRAAPATLITSALIRSHGIWLWLRGLPVQPRPSTREETS